MTDSGLSSPSADTRNLRCLRVGLILCLAFSFAAVFKGEPHRGYADIGEYFEDAEHMWLKFDLSIPGPNGPEYRRYPLGLAFISAPFVYLGVLVHRVSGGMISVRAVMSLIIPILGIATCLMLFELALAFKVSARAALWAAVIFGVAGPQLTFIRIFYTDIATVFFVVLAAWSWLKSQHSPAPGWQWLCGFSLAGIFGTHYGSVLLAIGMWLGFAGSVVFDKNSSLAQKVRPILSLTAPPAFFALVLLGLNYLRYGSPFRSGYDMVYTTQRLPLFDPSVIPLNLQVFAQLFVRVLWLLPSLWFLPAIRKFNRPLFLAAVLGLACQFAFWIAFPEFRRFPLRYPFPMIALASLGLPFFAARLDALGRRPLVYCGLILFVYNAGMFLRGDDIFPSFVVNMYDAAGGIICHVWYMTPMPVENLAWGSPIGPLQYAVLTSCLVLALISFRWAVLSAARLDSNVVAAEQPAVASPSIEFHSS